MTLRTPGVLDTGAFGSTLFGLPGPGVTGAAAVVIAGVPFDAGNGVLPGAGSAPGALREHSLGPDAAASGSRAALRRQKIPAADHGDVAWVPGEPGEWLDRRIGQVCDAALRSDARVLFLGGDHSVTFPVVRHLQMGGPLAVLWVDAHTDTASDGVGLNHKNVARKILDLPNVAALVQVGFRGFTQENEVDWKLDRRTLLTSGDFRRRGPEAVLASLPPDLPLYVSLDIDVLDPAHAPGTGTPVPSGLGPAEVEMILDEAACGRRLVGCDLVEVNPGRDVSDRTLSLATTLLFRMICLLAGVHPPVDNGVTGS
jgi:agmatinase